MDSAQYKTADLLAAGSVKTATRTAELQLEGLHRLLYSDSPAGGRAKQKLLDAVFEAKKAAHVAAQVADKDYLRIANSPQLPG